MKPTECSEGEKLEIHAGEDEVRRLLGGSKGKETEPYRYLSAYDVPGIVMSDECVFCVCALVHVIGTFYSYIN